MAFPVDLPPGAYLHLPVLIQEIKAGWSGIPYPSVLAAQVEQESRWKEKAKLDNPKNHELGVGLGQFTKTNRFDALTEMKDKYPSQFTGWGWENPYDVRYQLRGLVLKNRDNYRAIKWAKDDFNRMAMMGGAYNQGLGGMMMRKRICANTPGCDPAIWFGNMEFASNQSKKPQAGYKQSFADITRNYVKNLMVIKREKYLFMDKEPAK